MTSEPDSTPRRRPPTIDLTAKEVETDTPTDDSGGSGPAGDRTRQEGTGNPPGSSSAGLRAPYAVAALAGAIVAAAIMAGLWVGGYVPSRAAPAQPVSQAPKGADVDEIAARLDKIQGALQARQPDTALSTRIASAEAETKTLGDSLTALTRRLDEVGVTARSALAQADAASNAADASKSAAQTVVRRSDLDALGNRISALERAVKSLTDDVSRRTASADDRAARVTVVAEALRMLVERGAPYRSQFAALQSLGADPNELAPLEPFAVDGVPSAPALARELAMLTPTLLRKDGAATSEGSFLGRLETNAQRLVRISPIDAPAGNDSAATIARSNAAAARGDLSAAVAEIGRLPDVARSVVEPWIKKVDARERAVAASRRIAADALAALGKPAPQ